MNQHVNSSRMIVCDGNEAAARAVVLARPDVVSVFPITPQSSLVESLAQFVADGALGAELINAEGEHSVLSALQGACLAGARTYTATSGPGLAFMFEPYVRTPGLRLPMVVSLVTRDMLSPQCVWGGQQDAMTVRECGWIQIYCEDVQEVLDTVVMAFKLAEHKDVLLPVNVCHDGNYLSYGVSRVELPAAELVDQFLGQPEVNWHIALDPERPMSVDPLTGGTGPGGAASFVGYRKSQVRGMAAALEVFSDIHAEWGERFGRHWAPLVEEYRLEDADIAIITIGSMTGAGKDAVDAARDCGQKVGLIKVKTYRPFPREAMIAALGKVKAAGIVDRSVSFAWDCGPLHQDVMTALFASPLRLPLVGFIGGLAGADITATHFERVIAETTRAAGGNVPSSPVWLNEHD
ncbi:NADH-dependent phenylglyoxylate dehydrogenase subunit alpha [Candidatus Terasakiella magnetica]|nr:NADH-dependent phenylglyoxylate dehydrogenase subunit alpha [Candidatus Terasakiella magnetica]